MRLDCVETFYLAATLGSVTEASARLSVSQTAASARIRVLEDELATALLERRADRRVRLTTDGQRFLREAEKLLGLWRRIKSDFGSSPRRATTLRVGAIESVLHSWLIPWIEALQSQRPQLQIELTVETTPLLTELVRRGGLDFVLATLPAGGEGLRARALAAMPMVFAGSRVRHRRRRYGLTELAREGFLTFQRGSQPHAALLDLLRAAGVDAPRVHAVSSVSAMARMVTCGFGVATLPRATLDDPVIGPGLRALPCDAALAELPIHASWRHDPTSEELDAVVEGVVRVGLTASSTGAGGSAREAVGPAGRRKRSP